MTALVWVFLLGVCGMIVLRIVAGIMNAVARFLSHFQLLWRFLTGARLDGKPIPKSAKWSRPARAGVRIAGTAAAVGVAYGWAVDQAATITGLWIAGGLAAAAIIAQCVILAVTWRLERHHIRPLERTLMSRIPVRPTSIQVTLADDSNAVKAVAIEYPPTTEIGAAERQHILEAVADRLAIESPEPKWQTTGRNRAVTLTHSEPPPFPVTWDDIATAVKAAKHAELVFGLGKKRAVSSASYSDSPHLMIPGGSGGGKSNLAAVLLLQEMRRGSLIFNLDPKWISHLWLQGLPNVINAHKPADLHLALTWLGQELLRRTEAVWWSAAGTGRVRATPGQRIVVLAEELNYGMPDLLNLWREIRSKTDPKLSPAIQGMSSLATAGRASDMHLWLIAQLLTVKSTGLSDSTIRTNAGIKAMLRWDEPGWKMAVGKHVPMPPPTDIPGRIQLVTASGMRETQVPYLHLDDKDTDVADQAVAWARALAVSGQVATIPTGPEGVPPELWPAGVRPKPLLALPPGQSAWTGRTVPPGTQHMTIREAVDDGVFGALSLDSARKRVQRRRLEPTGQGADGSYTYLRAHLTRAAQSRRKELTDDDAE